MDDIFLSDDDLRQIRNDVENMRELSHYQNVYLLKETTTDCPQCSFDPITNESTDITCTHCGGTGVMVTTVKLPITVGLSSFEHQNTLDVAGVVQNSSLVLDLSIEDYEIYKDYIDVMKKIEIDNFIYRIKSKRIMGIGLPNRVLINVEKVTP